MAKNEMFYPDLDLEEFSKMDKIEAMWKKFFPSFNKVVSKAMLDAKILPNKDYGLDPDFSKQEAWVFHTQLEKYYSAFDEEEEKEIVLEVEGFLFFTLNRVRIRPSFRFMWNQNKISVNKAMVEEIMKNHITEKEQIDLYLSGNQEFDILNKLADETKVYYTKEAKEVFKSLGFDKDEINLMTVGALEHEKFNEGMKIDDFIGLALKVRGEQNRE